MKKHNFKEKIIEKHKRKDHRQGCQSYLNLKPSPSGFPSPLFIFIELPNGFPQVLRLYSFAKA